MARWEPDAQERLREAALVLYETKGYEETTVAEIAAAAGLTERTFFRYFSDKREVLFAQTDLLHDAFIAGAEAPASTSRPLDLVEAAVIASSEFFPNERLPHSRRRQSVIVSNPELRERELRKMSSWAEAIGKALLGRGVSEPAATLAAESGILVFRIAFERWVAPGNTQPLVEIERTLFEELRALA